MLLILVSKYDIVYFIKKKKKKIERHVKIGDINAEFYRVEEETFCIELDILGYKRCTRQRQRISCVVAANMPEVCLVFGEFVGD